MPPRPPKNLRIFTAEEDALIVHLKATTNKTWKEIATFFPTRSKGSLQVRYCRKLFPEQQGEGGNSLSTEEADEAEDTSRADENQTKATANIQDTSELERPLDTQTADAHPSTDISSQPGQTTSQTGSRPPKRVKLSTRKEPAMDDKTNKTRVATQVNKQTRTDKLTPKVPLKPWVTVPPLSRTTALRTGAPLVFSDPPVTHIIEYNAKSGSHRIRYRRNHEREGTNEDADEILQTSPEQHTTTTSTPKPVSLKRPVEAQNEGYIEGSKQKSPRATDNDGPVRDSARSVTATGSAKSTGRQEQAATPAPHLKLSAPSAEPTPCPPQ